MGLLIIRPTLIDGLVSTYTDSWVQSGATLPTDQVLDIIDMDLVGGEFRRVYTMVNGELDASNFDSRYVNRTEIDERTVRFPEFYEDANDEGTFPPSSPGVGLGHSHNGYDSSFLGFGAIDSHVTQLRSFGAWMCPSNKRAQLHYHGIVPLLLSAPNEDDHQVEVFVEIPYDTALVPRLWSLYLTEDTQVSDSVRVLATLQCLNPNIMPYLSIVRAEVVQLSGDADNSQAHYLKVTINFRDHGEQIVETEGLYLHWNVFLMIHLGVAG